MRFTSTSTIDHPLDQVFAAYRDRLPDVVPFMDDIESVVVLDRSESGDVVTLHNEWSSANEIPAVARSFLTRDQLKWDDHATWDGAAHQCRFDIKTRAFRDAVRCTGTNTFTADGDRTRVVLEGVFEVDVKAIPGVPKLLAGRIVPQIEAFIVKLIQPNLEKTNDAVGRFLDAGD